MIDCRRCWTATTAIRMAFSQLIWNPAQTANVDLHNWLPALINGSTRELLSTVDIDEAPELRGHGNSWGLPVHGVCRSRGLLERYEIERMIGSGGMGVVF
jgi:hypothetical protein